MLICCVTVRAGILRILDWSLHGACCRFYRLPCFRCREALCCSWGKAVSQSGGLQFMDDLHLSVAGALERRIVMDYNVLERNPGVQSDIAGREGLFKKSPRPYRANPHAFRP